LEKTFPGMDITARESFQRSLTLFHLRVTPIPDVVGAFVAFRNTILASLMVSAILNCIPVIVAIVQKIDSESSSLNMSYRILCLIAMGTNILSILATFLFPSQLAFRQVAGDLIRWSEFKSALRSASAPK
jgi:hypothetical protein